MRTANRLLSGPSSQEDRKSGDGILLAEKEIIELMQVGVSRQEASKDSNWNNNGM